MFFKPKSSSHSFAVENAGNQKKETTFAEAELKPNLHSLLLYHNVTIET